MERIGGWEKARAPRKTPLYGNQRVYRRKE